MGPWWWRVGGGFYVGVVAALTATAFSKNSGFDWRTEGVALALTLPTLIVALPVIYVIGAVMWNLTHADSGGPMWPVTVVYTVMFVGVAIANLWVLRLAVRLVRSRLSKHQEVLPPLP